MKRFAVMAILFLVMGSTQAKKLPGYVVFPNNDTLHGQLRIAATGGFLSTPYNIYDEITITDSTGRDSTYYPSELTGFAFIDKSGEHVFRVKLHRDSTMKFQQVIVAGGRASLYYFEPVNSGGYGSPLVYFTFERMDGTLLFLKNYDKLETLQEKIKAFYGDAGGLGQFIDERFNARGKIQPDIKAIVIEANRAG